MLVVAIYILTLAVVLGMLLAGQVLIYDKPLSGLGWKQIVHAAAGTLGSILAYIALTHPGRDGHTANHFGWTGMILVGAALAGGLLILLMNMRSRGASGTLLAAHGSVALAGYFILLAYYTTPASYGH